MGRRIRNMRGKRNHVWYTTHGPVTTAPCYWCGVLLTFDESTLDHEPPKSCGNTTHTVISCRKCNQDRGRQLQIDKAADYMGLKLYHILVNGLQPPVRLAHVVCAIKDSQQPLSVELCTEMYRKHR